MRGQCYYCKKRSVRYSLGPLGKVLSAIAKELQRTYHGAIGVRLACTGGMKACTPALEQLALEYRQVIGRRLVPDALGLRAQARALTLAGGQAAGANRYDGYDRLRAAYRSFD